MHLGRIFLGDWKLPGVIQKSDQRLFVNLGTKDGFYKITGRIKDMIVRGGENIYPREIENYLYRMPQIETVEVVAVPSKKYGENVGAFIKVKKGEKLTEEEVTDFCRGKIARFKIPKYMSQETEIRS